MLKQPLKNIRVLDLSRLLPGPYFTMLLADLGAEVIKVETPQLGDYARMVPEAFGGPAFFAALNKGKKSLALNYRNRRGREVFLRLVTQADVVVEGFRPGVMARRGLGYETLRDLNPRLVYCSLSGYGQSGPYEQRVGHDLNYIAVGGLLDLNGAPGGPPLPPGVQIADLAGGMLAAMAVLAALLGRERTGEGAYLDVALFDAVVSWAGAVAGPLYAATGESPQRGRMALSGGLPCYNVYQTADGAYLSLGALEGPFWMAFCERVERPDLVARQWDPAAIPEVGAVMRTQDRDIWLARFEGVDACLEPVNTYAEMLTHPQVRHRGLVVETQEAGGRLVREAGSPFRCGQPPPSPAPRLGEHTRQVLAEAGFTDAEIQALEEKKIVRTDPGTE